MLPKEIIKRFLHPGQMEKDFMNYLKKSKAKVNQDKTLATNVLYHAVPVVTGDVQAQFFTGQYINTNTNIDGGSFVRPESEHFLIYAIRLYNGDAAQPIDSNYTRGGNSSSTGLSNAVVSLVCNSVQELKNVPLDQFDTDLYASAGQWRGTLLLDEPILWEGQTELEMTLRTKDPAGFSIDQALRFDLVGIGLI
jgi:hypothetical protein